MSVNIKKTTLDRYDFVKSISDLIENRDDDDLPFTVMLPLPGTKYTRATESLRLPVAYVASFNFGVATVAALAVVFFAGAAFLTVFVVVVFASAMI